MAGFGLGFGSQTQSRQYAALGQNVPVTVLRPSPAWDGTAGSGFAAPPTDPLRTTAKPVCRLLTPPNQYFTSELVIGVWAGANFGDSMLDDLGIDRVIAHCEGNSFTIDAPSHYLHADANGVLHRYYGWWVVLQHPGQNGHAQVYFEAVPKDGSMQRRVIGPYQFSPQATLHDLQIEVAATPAEVAGSRYRTLNAALAYLAAQAAQNPKITFTEAGNYDIASSGATAYAGGKGYTTITATAPITFRKVSQQTGSANLWRPGTDGLWFRGSNITFDFKWVNHIYHENAANRAHVFDGVRCIDSGGRYYTYLLSTKPTPFIARNAPWLLECDISTIPNPGNNARLVRGCTLSGGSSDVMTQAECAVGNTIHGFSSDEWRAEIPALTVQYSGAGASATLELSGGNNGGGRVLTAKVAGATVGSFTIQTGEADFTANTNYTVANVVAWLNTLAGWSASMLDNSRRAAALGKAGLSGTAFAATDVKTAALTLVTMIDVHADLWQWVDACENAVFADNLCYANVAQSLFLNPPAGMKDVLVVNNCFHQDEASPEHPLLKSQWSSTCSHVVVAHNSWANQALLLRTDGAFNPDGYCLLANNACPAISWLGAADSDLAIANNHLMNGTTAPAGAIGTTIGGTTADLFVQSGLGDFTPAGGLLTNPKTPVVRYDRNGVARGIPAALGAQTAGPEAAPAITSANPSGTYAEGVLIAGQVTANKPVDWSVIGADAAAVTINPATGAWSLAATDFESKSAYDFTFVATDNHSDTAQQAVAIAIADVDEIAPSLSAAQDSPNGQTGALLAVATNEGTGTLFWFVSQSATPPAAAALIAGTGAEASGSQAVTIAGTQSVAVSGLQAGTSYFAHFLHRDGASNSSVVASANGFTTDAAAGSGVTVVSSAVALNSTDNVGTYTASPFTFGGGSGRVLIAVVAMTQSATQAATALTASVNGVAMTRINGSSHSGGVTRPLCGVFVATGLTAGSKTITAALAGNARSCSILLLEVDGLDAANLLANAYNLETSSLAFSHSYTPSQAGNLVLSMVATRQGDRGPFTPDAGVTELQDTSSGTTATSDHSCFAGYLIASGTTATNVAGTSTANAECLFLVTELRAA